MHRLPNTKFILNIAIFAASMCNAMAFDTLPPTSKDTPSINLDNSFGKYGIFKTPIQDKTIYPKDAAIQTDGKIVVAMLLSDKNHLQTSSIIRLNANGTLDKEFGQNGITTLNISPRNQVQYITTLANGKIIITGLNIDPGRIATTLTRLNTDGSIDKYFANNGTLILPNNDTTDIIDISAIKVQADGKTIIGGGITIREQRIEGNSLISTPYTHFFLARITENGHLDSNFGNNGISITNVGGYGYITAIIQDDSGSISAAGFERTKDTLNAILVKYKNSGELYKHTETKKYISLATDISKYGQPRIYNSPDGKFLLKHLSKNEYTLIKFLPDGTIDKFAQENNGIKIHRDSIGGAITPLITKNNNILISGHILRPPEPGKSNPPYYYKIKILGFIPVDTKNNKSNMNTSQEFSFGAISDDIPFVLNQNNQRIILVGSAQEQSYTQLIVVGLAD